MLIIGIYDYFQTKHALLRNFPILGHIRYIMEFIRPELRQYIVASDSEEKPFNRETRNIVYRRAKNTLETQPFGTQLDPKAVNQLVVDGSGGADVHPRGRGCAGRTQWVVRGCRLW